MRNTESRRKRCGDAANPGPGGPKAKSRRVTLLSRVRIGNGPPATFAVQLCSRSNEIRWVEINPSNGFWQ